MNKNRGANQRDNKSECEYHHCSSSTPLAGRMRVFRGLHLGYKEVEELASSGCSNEISEDNHENDQSCFCSIYQNDLIAA